MCLLLIASLTSNLSNAAPVIDDQGATIMTATAPDATMDAIACIQLDELLTPDLLVVQTSSNETLMESPQNSPEVVAVRLFENAVVSNVMPVFGFSTNVHNYWVQTADQITEGVVQPTDFVVNLTTNIMANTNTMTADDHDEGCYQISVSSSTGAPSQTLHQQSQHPLLC